jgi:hypothetical protein
VSWQTAQPAPDTLIFDAAQPLALRMTLHVPAVEIAVDGGAGFDVDVPPEAATLPLNQTWPVDIPVEVAGQSLRFTEARLIETSGIPQLVLKTPALDTSHDRWMTGLRLAAITGPDGEAVDLALAQSSAGPDFFSLDRNYVAVVLVPVMDPESLDLRPGRYHVELASVTLGIRGPWTLSWDLLR